MRSRAICMVADGSHAKRGDGRFILKLDDAVARRCRHVEFLCSRLWMLAGSRAPAVPSPELRVLPLDFCQTDCHMLSRLRCLESGAARCFQFSSPLHDFDYAYFPADAYHLAVAPVQFLYFASYTAPQQASISSVPMKSADLSRGALLTKPGESLRSALGPGFDFAFAARASRLMGGRMLAMMRLRRRGREFIGR